VSSSGRGQGRGRSGGAKPGGKGPRRGGSPGGKAPGRGGERGAAGARRGSKPGAPAPARGVDKPVVMAPPGDLGASVRLQKILARAGISSRRGGEALIEAGRVQVNGRVVRDMGTKVSPLHDQITVDGRAIELESAVYIVLNKPDGHVSSAERQADARGRPTVVSLLKGVTQRVYPVGRLDYHTRGVLLLTNDGDLAARLTHPRYAVPKTYHAKFQGDLGVEALAALREGVVLEDGVRTQPLEELFVVKETDTNTWMQLTLTQGLNRQVRRMGDAIGHPVLKLIRVAVADITTDGLAEGEWRFLRESELADLRARVGL
jgi:23S rRNA pseudouridine2605 synthase